MVPKTSCGKRLRVCEGERVLVCVKERERGRVGGSRVSPIEDRKKYMGKSAFTRKTK
jgi:hypothetical protein